MRSNIRLLWSTMVLLSLATSLEQCRLTSNGSRPLLWFLLPLIVPDPSSKNSKELTLGFDKIVSPTSVIAFDQRDRGGPDCGLSGEFSSSCTLAFSRVEGGSRRLCSFQTKEEGE
uniref:Secreted protein n=1 Tax=Nelumbo nucifera TaxID=4432 RepID=A0A822YFA4_NELNU|nr:TPA_asm: hypothetical protein HUJ06_009684 [Nelumbo nucifera]